MGELLLHVDVLLPLQNKNLAASCGEVASQTYAILQYKNPLMAQYRCEM